MPHTREGDVRRLAAMLVAIVMLVVGCGGSSPTQAPAELPNLKPTPQPGVSYVAIVGDSYTSGSASGGEGPNGWPSLVTALLQRQGVQINPLVGAERGSGYTAHAMKDSVPFINQVRQVAGPNDRLVILFGSAKDRYSPPDQLTASVQRTLAVAKATAPRAKLLVIGPASSVAISDQMPALLQVRDIVKAQADIAGATFVDPLAEGWFADHPETVGVNGDYPNDAGHALLAKKIAPLIARQLSPAP
jgi:lysophospholipase L1-like esterase